MTANSQDCDDLDDLPELEDVPNTKRQVETKSAFAVDYTIPVDELSQKKDENTNDLFRKMAGAFQQQQERETKAQQSHTDTIKPSTAPEESPIIQDVKAIFAQQNLSQNETFLKQVVENQVLQRGMRNPRLMAIIKEMETNPAVVKQHAGDSEFVEFFNQYLKLIGQQMSKGGNKVTPEESIRHVGSKPNTKLKPEVERLLADAEVQELIREIQKTQRIDLFELARRNPALAQKAKVLIENGLFQVQRE